MNKRGATLTDDDHLRAYLNWKDSANVNVVFSRVESFGPARADAKPRRPLPGQRVYAVKVGSQVEGISEEMIQRILSIPDVRTIERGDTTYYVVGSFENIPDALRRELELFGMGLQATVVAEQDGQLFDVSAETQADRMRMIVPDGRDTKPGVVTVRVQLGAFRNRLSENIFQDIPDLVTLKGEDGLTRYYTGSFTNVNEAAAHKVRMLMMGFEGAFLVAFRDGRRVSISEAGAVLTGREDLRNIPAGSISKDKIRFRIQLGAFAGNVPMEAMDKFIEIGEVEAIPGADAVRYVHGRFTDRAAAEQVRQRLQRQGLEDAFVVGSVDGRIIGAEEAERLLREP